MPRRSARQTLDNTSETNTHSTSPNVSRKKAKIAPPTTKGKTPTRSPHFESANGKAARGNKTEDEGEADSIDSPESVDEEGSEFSEHPDLESSPSASIEEDDYSDEQPKRKRKASAKSPALQRPASVKRGTELWREGVATGLPAGVQVIIKKPKARSAGKTPYSDSSIHPNTILFLADLKANNDREWFKMHDPDYRASLRDWNSFVEVLTQKLIGIDETVPELPTKDITFRVHRDVRFSPDKTPYKPYFSAAWSRTGRKGPYAHYYVQISPGNSFVGGGLWHPEPRALAALRQDIDQNPRRLKTILMGDQIRKELLGGPPKKLEKVVQAFVSSPTNAETALKTKPKGYETSHADISLLRLRNYTVGKKLDDAEVLDTQGFLDRVAKLFAIIHPFVTCLNRIILPDPSNEDEENDDEEESETSTAGI